MEWYAYSKRAVDVVDGVWHFTRLSALCTCPSINHVHA